jgi:hypothetical protein
MSTGHKDYKIVFNSLFAQCTLPVAMGEFAEILCDCDSSVGKCVFYVAWFLSTNLAVRSKLTAM